ncbi:nuclear pore complex component-domain-containing protein [Nemania sp. FL0916]|nr:nuclear pore complex component-domain-containing protein [Nemania sp. FL0916]
MAPATAQTAVATPVKTPPTPRTESPGTWRHPRIQEITKRQQASTFGEKNLKSIIINIGLIISLLILHTVFRRTLRPWKLSAPRLWISEYYLICGFLLLPAYNIIVSSWPLISAKDDLADIPLTPGQRKLLGLPPSSAPPTPGSVYSTPPRYSRTPSASGSPARRLSFSSSPIINRTPSNQGSPTPATNGSGIASPSNHLLLQKAMFGARRSSLGSLGSPSPLRGSSSLGASIFGSGPESPSPSPAGKPSSVGLSNKWRYDKGLKPRAFRDMDSDPMYS